MIKTFIKFSIIVLVSIFVGIGSFVYAQSDEIEELSNEIENNEQGIALIEAQIKVDQAKLKSLEGEKDSLEKTITNLNYSENKLKKDIFDTERDITNTDQEIKTLSGQIDDLQGEILLNQDFIKETVVQINKTREKNFWEVFLLYRTFSEYLDRIARFETTGKVLKEKIDTLAGNKDELEDKTEDQTRKKIELVDLTQELSDKKQVVEITKNQKELVLQDTKNTEATYQQRLADKLELRREFEQTLLELESKLQIAIDKTLFAGKSQGLFSWPTASFRITQFFGNTSFAASGAYNGRGHSGTDFAVPIGTPVRAVMDGEVWSAFDTDAVGDRGADGVYRGCVSFGKYVLIKHDNGLSTLIAHNSLITVKNGQRVKRGDIIAYSGNSGFSTGPHLHFSTYATQGVKIERLGDVSNSFYCADAIIPIIALNAYLDPYDYLPRPKFALREVSFGDNNASVRSLQMALKHERIFPIEVSSNGQYGPTTAKAVAEWQKKYGLGTTDGRDFDKKSLDRYNLLFE